MARDAMVRLEPVTAENWQACAALDIHENQRAFIPSNLHSIAAAQFYPDNVARGVYAADGGSDAGDGQLVGFVLYGVEQPTGRIKLFRLMIAAPHQGRGYGAAAVRAVLRDMHERWRPIDVYVCYHPANAVAARLYQRLGFREVERTAEKVTARRDGDGEAVNPAPL